MERVLVVEDDQRLAVHLCRLAEDEGFFPHHVGSAMELDHLLDSKNAFDAVILDRLVDGLDTKSRVARMKRFWPATPILVLSAINTPLERAELLNLGVDDYLGKPFLSQELFARLRALMRRIHSKSQDYLEIGDSVLDLQKRILIRGQRQENLPAKEFLLLKALAKDAGRVISRTELLELVWNGSLDVETNVVEATIANLRRRISNLTSRLKIRNSRNVGYWIES